MISLKELQKIAKFRIGTKVKVPIRVGGGSFTKYEHMSYKDEKASKHLQHGMCWIDYRYEEKGGEIVSIENYWDDIIAMVKIVNGSEKGFVCLPWKLENLELFEK